MSRMFFSLFVVSPQVFNAQSFVELDLWASVSSPHIRCVLVCLSTSLSFTPGMPQSQLMMVYFLMPVMFGVMGLLSGRCSPMETSHMVI